MLTRKMKKLAFVLSLVATTFLASSTGFAQSMYGQRAPQQVQQLQQPSQGAWETQQLGAQLQGLYQYLREIQNYGTQLLNKQAELQYHLERAPRHYHQQIIMGIQQVRRELQQVQHYYTQVVSRIRHLYAYLGQLMHANPSEQLSAALSILEPLTEGHPKTNATVRTVGSVIELLTQTGLID